VVAALVRGTSTPTPEEIELVPGPSLSADLDQP
jgi:hypothetical protein